MFGSDLLTGLRHGIRYPAWAPAGRGPSGLSPPARPWGGGADWELVVSRSNPCMSIPNHTSTKILGPSTLTGNTCRSYVFIGAVISAILLM